MKFVPHPWQEVAIQHAVDFLSTATPEAKQLYAAPTGVGKSVVELEVQRRLQRRAWIVTPREEIIDGMLDKLGVSGDPLDHCISTPIRLRNRLMSGDVDPPEAYIFDETHHHEATSWKQLDLLSGIAPSVGYTASPYRGSPKSTAKFRETWGDPLWLISYQEAIDAGYISMPTFDILPLVDDDVVEVRGGEFEVTSIESATVDRLGDLAEHCKQWYTSSWDRPTIFAFPSSKLCKDFQAAAGELGLPVAVVSAETPKDQRREVFRLVEARHLALAHINIVSEGVDLKLRRYVDCDPCMSPVEWVQKLGRVTRPVPDGEAPPEYLCTNRNILRHAYILEGVVPIRAVADTEAKFGPTRRGHSRVLGMEAIGRFKPDAVRLLSGPNLYVYNVAVSVGAAVFEYCCLVHPTLDPIWCIKVNTRNEDGTRNWGTWSRCDAPDILRGFQSKGGSKEPSEKQARWWDRSAASYGLDPNQPLTRKAFAALPVLKDIGEHLE